MIIKSTYPTVDVPAVSLTEYVFDTDIDRNHVAYIHGDVEITLGELIERVAKMARGIVQAGLKRGDRVAIVAPSSIDWIVTFHGVIAAGGVVAPINPLATADELRHDFMLAAPRFVFCAEKSAALEALCGSMKLFSFAEDEFAALLAGPPCPLPVLDPPLRPRRDVALLPFSSGTTGRGKGVMLTHYNLVAQLCMVQGATHSTLLAKHDRCIAVLPLFHIYGIIASLAYNLHIGATMALMPRFDLVGYLQLVQQHRITRLHIVPPIVLALAKHPVVGDFDLSSLRGAVSAAAPLGAELAHAFTERLHIPIVQAYGMTELTGASHLGPEVAGKNRPATAGVLMPLAEAQLLDVATGAPVGLDTPGEICVRGPHVMKGYLGDAAATARTIDADGWLHTGDVGVVDADGVFTIVDRVKELIKYKGLQVAPAELEDVLLRHAQIADCAVVGAPDDEAGEIPKAFVVVRPGQTLAAEEVIAFVAATVAPHKRVRQVAFVEKIPRSASGKIIRRLLTTPI